MNGKQNILCFLNGTKAEK